jgi:hypothetical protein
MCGIPVIYVRQARKDGISVTLQAQVQRLFLSYFLLGLCFFQLFVTSTHNPRIMKRHNLRL